MLAGSWRGGDEVTERVEVAQGLAVVDAPGPFAPDRGAESQLQQGIEVVVGVADHGAEHAIDLVVGDRAQGHRLDRYTSPWSSIDQDTT